MGEMAAKETGIRALPHFTRGMLNPRPKAEAVRLNVRGAERWRRGLAIPVVRSAASGVG